MCLRPVQKRGSAVLTSSAAALAGEDLQQQNKARTQQSMLARTHTYKQQQATLARGAAPPLTTTSLILPELLHVSFATPRCYTLKTLAGPHFTSTCPALLTCTRTMWASPATA